MVWMTELKEGNQGEECGGSIIKDKVGSDGKRVSKYILTAAHCCVDSTGVDPKGPENFILSLGTKQILGSDGEIIYGVSKVHIHPDYAGPDTPHDIAILELNNEIVLDGKTKKAIKLADSDDKVPSVGTEVYR
jgi:secreted trypsin-like serine protease